MSDIKVKVSAPSGQVIGFFLNPKIENLADVDYEISGSFVDDTGRPFDKVDFNPEAIPYTLDLSQIPSLPFKQLQRGYVQHGRQPVVMTAART